MKKDGIQTRNRKTSVKSKRHKKTNYALPPSAVHHHVHHHQHHPQPGLDLPPGYDKPSAHYLAAVHGFAGSTGALGVGPSTGALGPSLGALGASTGALGVGPSTGALGPSLGALGASTGALGPSPGGGRSPAYLHHAGGGNGGLHLAGGNGGAVSDGLTAPFMAAAFGHDGYGSTADRFGSVAAAAAVHLAGLNCMAGSTRQGMIGAVA